MNDIAQHPLTHAEAQMLGLIAQNPLSRAEAQTHGLVEIAFRIDTTHYDFLTWLSDPLHEFHELKVDESEGRGYRILKVNLGGYDSHSRYIFVDELLFVFDPKLKHQPTMYVMPAFEIHVFPTNTKLLVSVFHRGSYGEIVLKGFTLIVTQIVARFPELTQSFENQLRQLRTKHWQMVETFEQTQPGLASKTSEPSLEPPLKNLARYSKSDQTRLFDWYYSDGRSKIMLVKDLAKAIGKDATGRRQVSRWKSAYDKTHGLKE